MLEGRCECVVVVPFGHPDTPVSRRAQGDGIRVRRKNEGRHAHPIQSGYHTIERGDQIHDGKIDVSADKGCGSGVRVTRERDRPGDAARRAQQLIEPQGERFAIRYQ